MTLLNPAGLWENTWERILLIHVPRQPRCSIAKSISIMTMQIRVLYSKIHRATVTDAQLHYEGSLTIDKSLMDLAGMVEYQQIDVYNITKGHRFTTYTIIGEPDTGIIQVNGAAAHLASTGDLIIISCFADIPHEEGPSWKPKLVFVNRQNRPAPKPALMPV
jgi:aspartate 1-decarboxylase